MELTCSYQPIGHKAIEWKTKLDEQLKEYTNDLVAELSRRFGPETEMITGLIIFNHKDWIDRTKYLNLQGFDKQILTNEASNISRHITLTPQIDTSTPFHIGRSFLKDEYTRVMFSEHSCLSTLILIRTLGSCAVERCFSYSTKICLDSRSALTISHVADLVRIYQQGPEFPKISEIQFPFNLQHMLPNNSLEEFINQVFNFGG